MKIYFPIAKVDGDRREVWGYASTEARDDQGEIVTRDALKAALGDYMKFANIREMHQLSAVGVAKEAAIDDKGLYVGAKIVDDQAWQKVVEGVYKGYSIGGRVTNRDPADHKIITGLVLNEISLVDRPANPEAVFDYWKAAGIPNMPEAPFHTPFQIWACGAAEHRHLAKSEAVRCQHARAASAVRSATAAETGLVNAATLAKSEAGEEGHSPSGNVPYADPGYQKDGKKRYPIDSEKHIRAAWNFINRPGNARRYTSAQLDDIKSRIITAWKDRIDRAGPPLAGKVHGGRVNPKELALTKALWDVGHIARIILELNWLEQTLAIEAMMEEDDSPQPARLREIVAELCAFLNALVAEETGEILEDAEIGGEPGPARAAEIVLMAAGAAGGALVAELCRAHGPEMRKMAAALLAKAKHSDGDQAILDLAYHAVDKCIGMNGLLSSERSHLAAARDALRAAGASSGEEAMADLTRVFAASSGPQASHPLGARIMTEVPPQPFSGPAPEMLQALAAALGKKGNAHQALMDIAHDCIGKLTDGMCCTAAKAGARHSQDTMSHLTKAHDQLVRAGAQCDADGFDAGAQYDLDRRAAGEWAEFAPKTSARGNLAKALAEERAEKAALVATLTEILPRLDQLTQRVEEIARTPLPPLAVAKNLSAISKQQDAWAGVPSADELAEAFARMSKEEQTLALIKASYARPMRPPGLAPAKDPHGE